MIVEQSDVLREKLDDFSQLERRQNQIRQINDTYTQLQIVSKSIQKLIRQYKTVSELLPEKDQNKTIIHFKNMYDELSKLAIDFRSNSEQLRPLTAFNKKYVIATNRDFEKNWAIYVNEEVSDERDTYSLLKGLPDIRANETSIENILSRIESFSQKPPVSSVELTEFQASVVTLRSQIQSIEGLTPGVKDFLRKIINKEAVIGDLTPEVLEWCQEPSRAESFVIRFT